MATEKTNRKFSVEINHSIRELTVTRVSDNAKLVFHALRASDVCRIRAEMLGFKNRIVDMAALGQTASESEKWAAMERIVAHLESGSEDWGLRVARSSSSDDALLVTALMEILGQSDRAKVAATVKSWSPEKRAAVRVRPDVKPVMDRLLAESAADVDTDELLAELMA
jgi:hypothetical protein